MRTIKLTIAYDGHAYHGWQKQPNHLTVQGTLEEMLSKICGEPITTAGSGRTDTGVHALAQTVTFTTNGRIPCANIVRASASLLPSDIVVLDAQEVADDFHARYSAQWKTYCYKLLIANPPSPFAVNYAWQLKELPKLDGMNEAAALLIGTHDFRAFRSSGSVESSPIKTIYKAYWEAVNSNEYIFTITGDGFLYHMVRNLVWSLVQVGLGKRSIQDFAQELTSQRSEVQNSPAPPQGLYLAEVGYTPYNL